jgi:hypothetical protein
MDRVSPEEIKRLHAGRARNSSLHGVLMEKAGWSAIDGLTDETFIPL